MPFLSIIIPVYNKGLYLDKCLQSIASQSFTDWEVILVDDGSTDSSAAICDKWQHRDKRFKVIHQQNAGVSAARNNGLESAGGEYVQFTDADDWWGVGAFQTIYDELTTHGKPDVIIYGMTKTYPSGETESLTPSEYGLKTKQDFLRTLIEEQKRTGIYGSVCNKWTLRSLIEENRLRFNTKYNLLEDYDFFLSVFECSSGIALSQQHSYFYLQEAVNSSTSSGFRFHYPHIMAIRLKAYAIVNAACGCSTRAKSIIKQELEDLYLGMFVELNSPTYATIKQLNHEVAQLLKNEITLQPRGSSLNSRIIAFLLNKQALLAICVYLTLRKLISHA